MKRLFAVLLLSCLAWGQNPNTSRFPNVPTDTDLPPVSNVAITTLSAAITSTSQTTVDLADASKFTMPGVVTIENEHIRCTGKTGNQLTGCTRGFDGSTAATHANGLQVNGYLVAWHLNQAFAEIKAQASWIKTQPWLLSTQYDFTPQTPGGTLTGGVGATVTLSPCPLGVNGTDTGHYLYISGGTGTAEAVLITGGTCNNGATSGTITFTPANAHSGAWTIASASGGIKEAATALGAVSGEFEALGSGGGIVWAGAGTITAYAPIILPTNVTLQGSGEGTIIKAGKANISVVTTEPYSTRVGVRDITIDRALLAGIVGLDLNSTTEGRFENIKILGGGAAANHSIGVRLKTTSNGIAGNVGDNTTFNRIANISIIGGEKGIVLDGDYNQETTQGGAVTFNTIDNVLTNLMGYPALEFVKNADHNMLRNIIAAYTGAAGTYGIVFNSASPTTNQLVEGNLILGVQVDATGAGGSTGIQFNHTTGNTILGVRNTVGLSPTTVWAQTANTTNCVVLSNSLSASRFLIIPNGQGIISHLADGTLYNVLKVAEGVIYFGNTGRPTVLQGVSEYADNAAAISGGLPTGAVYRTGDALKIVH